MQKYNCDISFQKKGEYPINVLYCGDKGIADGLIMSVISLLQTTNEIVNIYVVTAGCKHKNKTYQPLENGIVNCLDEYSKQFNGSNSVTLIDATYLFDKTPLSANLGTRFTPMCMLRLFADELEAIPEKILYLDYDVICKKEVSELYTVDIDAYQLAGVLDRYGKWFFRKNIFKPDYLNSGVLLLNMKEIRKTKLFADCRKRCAEKKMFMPDQSAINKLSTKKLILPSKFNTQKEGDPNTVLRHFTTFFKFFPIIRAVTVKPWHTDRVHTILKTHEYDGLTEEYLKFKKHIQNKMQ